jgi:hypothetical protein
MMSTWYVVEYRKRSTLFDSLLSTHSTLRPDVLRASSQRCCRTGIIARLLTQAICETRASSSAGRIKWRITGASDTTHRRQRQGTDNDGTLDGVRLRRVVAVLLCMRVNH